MPTLFERIIAGELPATILHRDDRVTAFRDIHPRAPTHILIAWRLASDADPTRDFFALMALARALGNSGSAGPQRLVLLTHQLFSVHDERARDPEQALAAGALAVVAAELAPLSTTVIDISAGSDSDDEANASDVAAPIVSEVLSGRDARVALRRGERWLPDFARLPLTQAPAAIREHGTYLITGGLGGIALTIADALSRQARVRIILVSRRPLPPGNSWDAIIQAAPAGDLQAERIQRIRAIEARGSEVVLMTADVAVPADVDRLVQDVTTRMGPIHGVVHAAGVMADSLLALKSADDARRVLAPKVTGTLNLARALDHLSLDFWVNCSSVSAMIGLPGQFDYAAANAFLDAFAHARSGLPDRGPTVSIDWQAWRDVGMLREPASPATIDSSYRQTTGALLRSHRASGQEHHFATAFAPDADWVLAEHRLSNGTALLPGTSYLAMAAEAAHVIGRATGTTTLRDVIFLSPFVVTGDSRVLHVTVAVGGAFVMSSRDGAESTEHVRGLVTIDAAPGPVALDLAAIRARCPVPATDPTPNLRHLQTGPRWTTRVDAHVGAHDVIADLEIAVAAASDLPSFDLHPAVLDVATAMGPLLVDGYDVARDFYVPLSYDSVRIHAPLRQTRLTCHTRLSRPDQASRDLVVVDVTICTTTGQPLVEITGFAARRLAANAAVSLGATASTPARRTALDLTEAIRPEEGAEAFLAVLRSLPIAQVAVGPKTLADLTAAAARLSAPAARAHDRTGSGPSTAPRTASERALVEALTDMLGADNVGIDDDFFALGGHSLLAVRLATQMERRLGVRLPLTLFFSSGTVRQLAAYIDERRPAAPTATDDEAGDPAPPAAASPLTGVRSLVPIRPAGHRTPIFAVHAGAGQVLFYRHLVPLLGEDRPFYGLQAPAGLDGRELPYGGPRTAEDLAGAYLEEMRQVRPSGPYVLIGSCAGGPIALEMAQRLTAAGETVEALLVFDSWLSNTGPDFGARLRRHARRLVTTSPIESVRYLANGLIATVVHGALQFQHRLKRRFRAARNSAITTSVHRSGEPLPQEVLEQQFIEASVRVMTSYHPRPYHGRVALFRSATYDTNTTISSDQVEMMGWRGIAAGPLEVFDLPGDHLEMLDPPIVPDLARRVLSVID